MATKKDNPLIGSFRASVPDTPPPAGAIGEQKPTEPSKDAPDPKAVGTIPAKGGEDQKPAELPKGAPDPKATGTTPAKDGKDQKPAEPSKDAPDPKATGTTPVKSGEGQKPAEPPKDTPNPKATGATPTKDGKPDIPIPGKLIPLHPAEPEKPAEPPKEAGTPAAPGGQEEEIPKDFTLPITREGQSEIITTLKVADIHPFEGHPFNVKDDKDMWDLVDSVKKFGILEPVVVIPRQAGGYEMVSGHRRQRACQLAGIQTMPVIVRQLDRDEATISMVDANMKRENISPMEKARAYSMKLEAMKRKAGRRSKAEILSGEKPMRADEQLAQQTGESRANIQKITRLTKLEPELQQMVDDKKLPVHTAADISYLKKDEQKALADAIKQEDKVPSGTQAAALKKESQAGTLTTENIKKAVAPTKREETPVLKITLGEEDLRPYFPDARTTMCLYLYRSPRPFASPGELCITHPSSREIPGTPTHGETAAISSGRRKSRMTVWRPPSGISRAALTCTPTCSQSCPRLFRTTVSGCSWSTATFSPVTPSRPRSGQRRRPSTTCWIVWRMGTLRRLFQSRSSRPLQSRKPLSPQSPPGQRRRKNPALKNRGRCDRRRNYGIYPP